MVEIGKDYLRPHSRANVICPGSPRTDRHLDAVIRAMRAEARLHTVS
jgi:hypothetical protein